MVQNLIEIFQRFPREGDYDLFSYRRFICLEANILLCKVLWAVDQLLLFSFSLIYDGRGSSQKIIYFSEIRVS